MTIILKDFDKEAFINRGKRIITTSLRNRIEKNLQSLKDIAAKLDASDEPPSKDTIADLKRKIKAYILTQHRKGASNPISIRERRLMCYFASDIVGGDIDYLKIAFVIEDGWADRYISPLMRFCLNHWNNVDGDAKPLYSLFIKHLKWFKNQQRLREWNANIRFFKVGTSSQNGALQLGKELRDSGLSPLDFQSKLDIAKDLFRSEYFQKVLIAYYDTNSVIPENIETVLDEHGNADTTLILLADFINKVSQGDLAQSNRLKLQSLALRKIGHPSLLGKWKLYNKDKTIQNRIESARKTINNWLVQDYINEIFRALINDPRRKKFWIKYSNIISDVRVVGPSEGKRILSRIDSLKDSLEYCFNVTSSSVDIYAFVMKIDEFTFIEFSNLGNALYIYKNDSQIETLLNSRDIKSVSSLKNKALPNMPYSNGNSCRMVHNNNNWEKDLESWIERYVK